MDQANIQEIEEIRVVTIVGAATPELHRELASTPVRARAERLRYLAGHGLAFLQSQGRSSAIRIVGPEESRSAIPISTKERAISKRKAPSKASATADVPRQLDQVASDAREDNSVPDVSIVSESTAEGEGTSPPMTAHPSLSLFARSLGR